MKIGEQLAERIWQNLGVLLASPTLCTQLVRDVESHTTTIERICQQHQQMPAVLETPSRQVYCWLKFLCAAGNLTAHLEALRDAGVRAFKCFLSPSGVDEFAHVTERDLSKAFPVLARLVGEALTRLSASVGATMTVSFTPPRMIIRLPFVATTRDGKTHLKGVSSSSDKP